jgi:hypothetical protein
MIIDNLQRQGAISKDWLKNATDRERDLCSAFITWF